MAREVRSNPRSPSPWIARIFRVTFILGVLLVIANIIAHQLWPANQIYALACQLGVALCFGSCFLIIAWRTLTYRCPVCRKRLWKASYRGSFETGDEIPIHYICPRCEIEWDTGRSWSPPGSI